MKKDDVELGEAQVRAGSPLYKKHFPGAEHGSRYTYVIRKADDELVHWTRSDGLKGCTPIPEWRAYFVLVHEPPKPIYATTQRDARMARAAAKKRP